MVKQNQAMKWTALIGAFVIVAVFAGFLIGGGQMAITGQATADEDGEARWADKVVNYKLVFDDAYATGDVDPLLKVYEEQPEDYGNPRGDFDEAELYNSYQANNSEALIDREEPGTYYVVATASGYNTEFFEITIPDGSQTSEVLADYQAEPDRKVIDMTQQGTASVSDFNLPGTLTNDTSVTKKDTQLVTVDESTEFRGWKVVFNDDIGFSADADGDGVYDEGINRLELTVGETTFEPFDVDNAVNEFSPEGANSDVEFMLGDLKVADEDDLKVSYEMDIDETEDGTVVDKNDEKLSEGDGDIGTVTIFDDEGDQFAQITITT